MIDMEQTIRGNLADEPSFRIIESTSQAVCDFRVLVSRGRRVDGEFKKLAPRAYKVVAWGELAEAAFETLSKGDRVTVVVSDAEPEAWANTTTGEIMSVIRVTAAEISKSVRQIAKAKTELTTTGPADQAAPQRGPARVPATV
ncbi:MAG: single-stranded DNA-binding protein [Pseudonocardiaceae bacterium]